MRLKITKGFRDKLNAQVAYIAQDKPSAARQFKEDIIQLIKAIPDMPYKNRKSIFSIVMILETWFLRAI